jgi:hypothetical protein
LVATTLGARQARHALRPAVDHVPAAQAEHEERPGALAKEPARQDSHAVAPVAA